MSLHTVRIELHGGTDEEYKDLHAVMRKAGFSRTVRKGGTTYELPTAEYSLRSKKTTRRVRSMAEAAADETGRPAAILVTTGKRRFTGLKKV
jgi:N-acetylglucosamine-6-phosphate deacetylase